MSSRKKSGSLAWRLTARQTRTLLRTLFYVDVALLLLFCLALLGHSEMVFSGLQAEDLTPPYPDSAGYTVTLEDYRPPHSLSINPGQYGFLDKLQKLLPGGDEAGPTYSVTYRSLTLSDTTEALRWYQQLDRLEYRIAYGAPQGGYYTVTFHLGNWMRVFRLLLQALLVYELILVYFSIGRTRRAVKRTLRPIEELTLTAKSMTVGEPRPAKPAQPAPHYTPPKLKLSGAIDTLNTINEDHLDMRISIEDEREELRGLALAINGMLDRLNAAYQSQLRFVSDASHELRTPIAVIQGYANLLDRWGKTDEKTLQESIDAIKAEAGGMQSLVEQLLFLARSDNNSIRLEPEVVDATALVKETLRDAKLIDESHPFSVTSQEGLLVYGDFQLLKQALRILVENAIKYTPSGEPIAIAAQDAGGTVKISVTDYGIGIPEKDLPNLFDRFFRADESRARKSGGTGLGLSIFRWIIDRHGGYVEVVSRLDIGSRFSFYLPKPEEIPAEAGE